MELSRALLPVGTLHQGATHSSGYLPPNTPPLVGGFGRVPVVGAMAALLRQPMKQRSAALSNERGYASAFMSRTTNANDAAVVQLPNRFRSFFENRTAFGSGLTTSTSTTGISELFVDAMSTFLRLESTAAAVLTFGAIILGRKRPSMASTLNRIVASMKRTASRSISAIRQTVHSGMSFAARFLGWISSSTTAATSPSSK